MSNVKNVEIVGMLPFNIPEHKELSRVLGSIQSPSFGLKLSWHGAGEQRPNKEGGVTTFYGFRLSGSEAVNNAWLDHFADCVDAADGNLKGIAYDEENGMALVWEKEFNNPDPTRDRKCAGFIDMTPEPGSIFNRFIEEIIPETDAVVRLAGNIFGHPDEIGGNETVRFLRSDVIHRRSELMQRLNALAVAISLATQSTTNTKELKILREKTHVMLEKFAHAFQRLQD